MAVVDGGILSSILQLSNHFAEKNGCIVVKSPADLWRHGTLFATLLELERNKFESSKEFYDVLRSRFNHTVGVLAESLDVSKASEGDLMEVCKFHVLILEYMRREQGDMLKKVLENLSHIAGFDSDAILKLFSHFDQMYEDDDVDEWWSILCQDINQETIVESPTHSMTNFVTPKSSMRPIKSVFSNIRSPIVDAIDSPTMKYMRIERELKQLKRSLDETETKLEESESENSSLLRENYDLKNKLETFRSHLSNDRNAAQRSEEDAEFWKSKVDSQTNKIATLEKDLNGARHNIRTLLRQLESAEKEQQIRETDVKSLSLTNERLLHQLRDSQLLQESDRRNWEMEEAELRQKLQFALEENANNKVALEGVLGDEKRARLEVERLSKLNQSAEFEIAFLKKNIDELTECCQKLRDAQVEAIQKERKDRDKAVSVEVGKLELANRTIARLTGEVDRLQSEQNEIKTQIDTTRAISFQATTENHERGDAVATIKSCLVAASNRIVLLEAEVEKKEAVEKSLKNHLEQISDLLVREQQLRKSTYEQNIREKSILEKKWENSRRDLTEALEKTTKELEEVKQKYEDISELYNGEVTDYMAIVNDQKSAIEELQGENKRLANLYNLEKRENQYIRTQSQFFKNEVGSQKLKVDSSLADSLSSEDLSLKNNGSETNSSQCVPLVPSGASVAFTVDMEETKEDALSTKFNVKDDVIANSHSLERENDPVEKKLERVSLHSECSSFDYTASDFKNPFMPKNTDRDRINELKQRNSIVAPHLRCSYVTEDANSPSGNEENLKKGDTWKKSKVRRRSLSTGICQLLNIKPKE